MAENEASLEEKLSGDHVDYDDSKSHSIDVSTTDLSEALNKCYQKGGEGAFT